MTQHSPTSRGPRPEVGQNGSRRDGTWTREAEHALHALAESPTHPRRPPGQGLPVAFTPDGRRVATAGQDGTARLWDATTGEAQLTLRGHTGAVYAVAFADEAVWRLGLKEI